MWSEEKINEYLRNNLKSSRYEHSLGVKNAAIKLALTYGENSFKAGLAGIVHDCAKNMSNCEIVRLVKENAYEVDDIYENSPELLHGLAGAIVAKNIMGIEDEDIFNAIAYHTTARENMSLLEKIIYIADYVEPSRNFPGVEELRKVASENLEDALILSLSKTICYVVNKGQLLHSETVKARNYLIIKRL
jgi:predicted HD superfamily hydrolase involved in NAD metabolism